MILPKIKLIFVTIILLTIFECSLIGYIGWWRDGFWSSVSEKQEVKFWLYISYFCIAALSICYISAKNDYLRNYLSLVFRTKLTRIALKKLHVKLEGLNQRVQEDCLKYPSILIDFIYGLFKNLLILGIALYLLLKALPIIYLVIPLIYSIFGTMIASYLAYPLVALNYINQVFEARFRELLNKRLYAKVYRNNYNLFIRTKKVSYFQYFYGQITVIVPYLLLAGAYFNSVIVFGVFMQCAALINQIIECLSYFINSINSINLWLSCRRRLKELGVL